MIGNTFVSSTGVLPMSWKNRCIKQEKLLFIADWLKEEHTFTELCERYQVSRKTGYKLVSRYQEEGERAFEERSHARHHHPNATAAEVRGHLLCLKHRFPKWGPAKIRDWLSLEEPGKDWPSASTIGALYERHGLVKPRRYRRKTPSYSEPFLNCSLPNEVWSADFKGQFKVGSGRYCYPLTISDNYSRYLLGCEGFESPNMEETIRSFERVFKEYGLPKAIRTDNGYPFASVGIGGLTRLSIWWLKLGILPERIRAGCPQENGRHERMHRTLKEATAVPAQGDFAQQQRCFDEFRQEYNEARPHEALGKKRPASVYTKSSREYPGRVQEVSYPDPFIIRRVKTNGELKWHGKRYYVSELLHREPIGLEVIDEGRAIVYFAKLKLGLIDARKDQIIRP
jgi:putative transposase